ncbi:MAG TPA: aldehyde ferredoxin oxidoreductase C-terminal domain-containing protein [Dehalococcoidia bacterium]|nr:aldehyde ferredoxin oxidoreductase C-terminal domain-containing protein [Dehalococcoidia bacterium]
MPSVLRVDMSRLRVHVEPAPEDWRLLGGRALTSHIVSSEVDPRTHPLAPEAKLVFAPGLLGGTAVTTSGRASFGARSPLMGGLKESNVGGVLGQKLARLGIKAVIVENAPDDGELRVLHIAPDLSWRFAPAGELRGLGNYDTATRLLDGTGGKTRAVVSIGPAGEMRMAAASIAVNDPEGRPTRHAARGGLGALMGAKGLKAIVVDDAGTKNVEPADPAAYREAMLAFSRIVRDDPRTQNLSRYGTAGVIKFVNRDNVHSLPTRNHRLGTMPDADAIGGQRIAEVGEQRGGKMLPCMAGCIIKCAILFNDAGGAHVTSALEFETIALLGSNLEVDDVDAVARMDRLCDDLGLDTIEMGNAFGLAMEAGVLPWGDWQGVIRAFEQDVRQGTPLGRILGGGTEHVARSFGIARVPAVKGQGLPAWEPRTLKAMGITYATSPQGADHTAGLVTARGVTHETLLRQSRHEQLLMAAVDSAGLCQFSNPVEDDIARFVSALYGVEWTKDDVLALGRRVLVEERDYNRAAGFGPDSAAIPEFLRTEPLHTSEGDQVFDVDDALIDAFWDFE